MGRLREIPRTAAFAWSAGNAKPFIATGTRAGAIDADFTSENKLELWDLDLDNNNPNADLKPLASLDTDSRYVNWCFLDSKLRANVLCRFYDLAWSKPSEDHSQGIIAGAAENGSLDLWDAAKFCTSASYVNRHEQLCSCMLTLWN